MTASKKKRKITSKPSALMLVLQSIPTWLIIFIATVSIVILRFLTDKEINLSQFPRFGGDYSLWGEALYKSLTVILASLGDIAIVIAALLFIKEIPDRKDQKHYEAWQVIDNAAAAGMPTSQARVKAIQDLNQDNITLEGLDAPYADLRGIEIPGANLRGANLKSSDLRDSNLEEADLSEAFLDNSENEERGANLSNANLTKVILEQAEISKVNFYDAILKHSNLRGANLSESNLAKADLTGADLESADLSNSDCEKTIFESAKLRYTNLSGVINLTESQLKTAWLCGTNLPSDITFDRNRDCKKFLASDEDQ